RSPASPARGIWQPSPLSAEQWRTLHVAPFTPGFSARRTLDFRYNTSLYSTESPLPNRTRRACRSVTLALAVATAPPLASGQVSSLNKGQSWFIRNGLQLQALSNNFDPFDLGRMQGANYSAVHWIWDSNVAIQGASPWGRWVRNESEMPPLAGAP